MSSQEVEVSRSLLTSVNITCESCGHQYRSESVIKAEAQPFIDLFTGNSNALKLEKKLDKFNHNDYSELPALKCPECGYTQSWNIIGSQKEKAGNVAWIVAGVIGLAAFVVGLKLVGGESFIGFLFAALLLIAFLQGIFKPILFPLIKRVYNPNKGKETAATTIYPKVSY